MNPEHYLQAANQALQQRDAASAERILLEAIEAFPKHPQIVQALAMHYYHSGKLSNAIIYFDALAQITGSIQDRCNLGMLLCDSGQYARALPDLEALQAVAGDQALVLFALARAQAGCGQPAAAKRSMDQAVAQSPADVDFRLFRAQLSVELDNWDAALQDMRSVAENDMSPPQRFRLAGLLLQTGQFTQAIPQYHRLLQQHPQHFEAWLGLGAACERANDLDGLQAAVLQAAPMATTPAQQGALAQLQGKLAGRQGRHADAAAFLQQAWEVPGGHGLWKSQVGFDLGISLDKCGNYAQAWSAFNEAHALRNSLRPGTEGDRPVLDFFRLLSAPLPAAWPSAEIGDDGNTDPVFVVGFPRSGTTLLEQILDAREGLVSFDEQPYLPKTLLKLQAMGMDYPTGLQNLPPEHIAKLRAYYFSQTEAKVPNRDGRRLVDKNPLNWARLPLVRALFPQAKIILALRHPCDVILSCYMQNLRSTVLGGAFSHFERIAELYMALVAYWDALESRLEMPVLVSRYEDLVTDPTQSTRRIAELLQIPWSDAWLDTAAHARGKAVIHTPSYAQVMEPLNQRAMGRWRNYRRFFDPELLSRLQPSIERMGYSLD